MSRLLLILLAVSAHAQSYVVAGIVRHPDGRPAKRVRVAISPSAMPENARNTITAADGAFRFEMPAGKYRLTAETLDGVVQPFGLASLSKGFGTAIVTGPGLETGNLLFRLSPPALIHGRVADGDGEPVENALVQIFVGQIIRGRRAVRYAGSRRTDDRGEYRFAAIRDGTYYLAVEGRPWYAYRADPSSSLAHAGFRATFYPNARDPGGAKPIQVGPGQEAIANFSLAAEPATNLNVHVAGTGNGTVRLELKMESVGGSNGFASVQSSSVGATTLFRGIHPGRYRLDASLIGQARPRYGTQTITVGNQDEEITISISDPPLVTGKITLADGAKIPPDMIVTMENEAEGIALRRAIAADGSFEFDNLPPLRYRPFVATSRRSLALRAITVDGKAVQEDTLDLRRAAQIELTSSLRGGALRGVVYRDGQRAPGVLALLAPFKDSNNPLDYRAFQTDSDGSFEWEALPPGDYVLIVKEDWFNLEYALPDVVRPLMAGGKAIHVEDGGAEELRIELSRASAQ